MNDDANIWALVLAAGEGSRLRGLTTTVNGLAVPKQFCSLRGGSTLLQEALQRARAVALPERVCSIVAAQHRVWWANACNDLPERNVIVQPENRGTAYGILLPLLHIAARDPDATVVLLPADHYVRDEPVLAKSLRRAAALAAANPRTLYLLGIEPEAPDTELGYILPRDVSIDEAPQVLQFLEKPAPARARALLRGGALWNAFIIAASVQSFIELYQRRFPQDLRRMREAVHLDGDRTRRPLATVELYRDLATLDFSRNVLEGSTDNLRVLRVPECGWTDLGTPQRVAATLESLQPIVCLEEEWEPTGAGLNLAAQHWRLSMRRRVAAARGAVA